MANHGGKREGAGKPKGFKANHTILVAEARKRLIDEYMKRQIVIDNALLTKAEDGDIPAIKEVYDRVFGKSLQTSEITTVKKLRLDDIEADKIADELTQLQKNEGTG